MEVINIMSIKKEIVFYTDGGCSGNPGPGAYGTVVYLVDGNREILLDCVSDSCEDTTNNREELKAILAAYEIATTLGDEEYSFTIYSDSAYCVNMANSWIRGWAANGWKNSKKKTVENLDLVKRLYNYLNINFFSCQILKVKGHAGHAGNEMADALAAKNTAKQKRLIDAEKLKIEEYSEQSEENKMLFRNLCARLTKIKNFGTI